MCRRGTCAVWCDEEQVRPQRRDFPDSRCRWTIVVRNSRKQKWSFKIKSRHKILKHFETSMTHLHGYGEMCFVMVFSKDSVSRVHLKLRKVTGRRNMNHLVQRNPVIILESVLSLVEVRSCRKAIFSEHFILVIR